MAASSLCGSAAALQPRAARRAVSARAGVQVFATAARDERAARAADGGDEPSSLSGEWAPTWSLGLGLTPARPVRSQQRHKTSTRSSANERANETAFDLEAAATLAKDWDALSSLASFDDVQAFYARRK